MKPLHLVKIGGKIAGNEEKIEPFLKSFAKLPSSKILVHGGGNLASELCSKLNIPIQMRGGRRITDRASLEVAVMVYAGLVNKKIVAQLQKNNINALGLSGADLNIIPAQKRQHPDIDFGLVGDIEVTNINRFFIKRLLDEQIVPVLSAITHDNDGQLLNTNADTIAATVAAAMASEFQVHLTYCFDKPGVLRDAEDNTTLIQQVSKKDVPNLKKKGIIAGGMLPKLENGFFSLQHNVHRVTLKDADNLLNDTGTTLSL